MPGIKDGFEWYCMSCQALLHRVEVAITDIVKDLPPLFDAFYADEKARTCRQALNHSARDQPLRMSDWVRFGSV